MQTLHNTILDNRDSQCLHVWIFSIYTAAGG